MRITYDNESGKHLVQLEPMLTVEESVTLLLDTKRLTLWEEFTEYDSSQASLERFLQQLCDTNRVELAQKGILYYELLLKGIEKGYLYLHNGRLRTSKLIDWMNELASKSKSEKIDNPSLSSQVGEVRKLKQQEKAILDEIYNLGLNPLDLPVYPPGTKGVRWRVRSKLNGKGLFSGSTVFKHAWDRLNDDKKIAYQPKT